MPIIVHHLENSRSQRILWMLEELGFPYEVKRYERNAKTMLAPPELRQVHPLGKSPVIQDGDTVVAETDPRSTDCETFRCLAPSIPASIGQFTPSDVEAIEYSMTIFRPEDLIASFAFPPGNETRCVTFARYGPTPLRRTAVPGDRK